MSTSENLHSQKFFWLWKSVSLILAVESIQAPFLHKSFNFESNNSGFQFPRHFWKIDSKKIYYWNEQSKTINPSDMDFKLQKNEDWLKDSMEKFSDIASDYIIESIYNKERERVSRTSSIMSKLCSYY